MAEPNWLVTALVGAVLGFILPEIWLYIKLFISRQRQHPLEGVWYGYYYIFEHKKAILRSEVLTIEKGLQLKTVKLVLKGESLENPRQKYHGEVWEEAGWLIIRMKPVGFEENIFIRFKNPIATADPIKYGLWSAIDLDTKPGAGPMILSRKNLSSLEGKRHLDSVLAHYEMDTTHKLLQVSF